MRLILPPGLDPASTLLCGQTFSWAPDEASAPGTLSSGAYTGCVESHPAWITTEDGRPVLYAEDGSEAFWGRYFRQDWQPEDTLRPLLERDACLRRAYARFPGLRLLRQPIWETLCMFVISANNNIRRITATGHRLRRCCGAPVPFRGRLLYAFPSPGAIAALSEEALLECGLGYRAAYLSACARRVQAGYDLAALPALGYSEALRQLLEFPGVGEKVADCVLLFSCGYDEAFPLDTWMRRIMRELYGVEGNAKQIKTAAHRLFGGAAGYAQQLLFHAARTGLYQEGL